VTAPGLSAAWSTSERRGEVLLDPVPAPDLPAEPPPRDDPSGTRGVAVAAPPRSVWRPQDAGPDAPPAPSPSAPDPAADGDGPPPPADGDGPPPPADGGSFS
jgi:hypothetical protein